MQSKTKQILRLTCGAQQYEWGKPGNDLECLVYKYLKQQHPPYDQAPYDPAKSYAELWMGIHPSKPSLVSDTMKTLSQEVSPIDIPFLFKVLSVNKALSIQVHPNKEQAKQLHMIDPKNYVDDNHKPEMAVALGTFEALSGFAPKNTIIQNVERNQQLVLGIGQQLWQEFKLDDSKLQEIVSRILSFDEQTLLTITSQLIYPESPCSSINDLPNQFPNDVGLIFTLFLNHVKLNDGEALVMEAGILHAYLRGNCLECMANSDNVVRAGFTPKFKDTNTLLQIGKFEMKNVQLVQAIKQDQWVQYESQFKEFNLTKVSLDYQEYESVVGCFPKQSIVIITEGYNIH